MAKGPPQKPFPTREQVLDWLREQSGKVGKREIARAFQISGDQRIALKEMLRELERDGLIDKEAKKRAGRPPPLPEVLVVEVTGTDPDGDVLARPAAWDHDEAPPRIFLAPGPAAPGTGERLLVRLTRAGRHEFLASVIRVLQQPRDRIVGVFERTTGKAEDHGRIRPTDRRQRDELRVAKADAAEAQSGEVVLAEPLPGGRYGLRRARVVERLGKLGAPQSLSLIAIHAHGLPHRFSPDAVAEAEKAKPVTPKDRTDLRAIPLVTIDGADARDFDDAVFAEPDGDPQNKGGWHLLVAIADVAHYVTPDSALDRDAYERGNSVYFPDRVVPMLPENLSNNLCSLRPDEDRACMAVHIWIDGDGEKLSHRFVRGVMRSVARLTYEQAQRACDGLPDDTTAVLQDKVIGPLYGAYKALAKARTKRGTLDLDLPERRVVVDPSGAVTGILDRQRLDSHRLIEEFMILANVCAAETLETARQPCMYRVHDAPSDEKLAALREFLGTLGLSFPKGQVVRPKNFMTVLRKIAGRPEERMVNEVVLRSQAQAAYSPDNLGHFGLALRRYAHFTSPIRRYADLLVHRALIRGLRLGAGGLPDVPPDAFAEAGTHISATERRAAQAEREVVDRYTAAYLADQIGATFTGRISGVTRFGLFVTLAESGADGLVPIRTLPQDYYHHDEAHHRLVGDRWGRVFALGEDVTVKLLEADVVTGSLNFALELEEGAHKPARRPPAKRGRREPRKSGRSPGSTRR